MCGKNVLSITDIKIAFTKYMFGVHPSSSIQDLKFSDTMYSSCGPLGSDNSLPGGYQNFT
jgi:hypothetical protein